MHCQLHGLCYLGHIYPEIGRRGRGGPGGWLVILVEEFGSRGGSSLKGTLKGTLFS